MLTLIKPSHKTFKIKRILGKKQKQNRPIPNWIRFRTDTKIRYNAKRRNWRRTKCMYCIHVANYLSESLSLFSGYEIEAFDYISIKFTGSKLISNYAIFSCASFSLSDCRGREGA